MEQPNDTRTRRRFLSGTAAVALAGVGVTGSLAGCSGRDGGATGGSDGDGGDASGGGETPTPTPTPTGLTMETLEVGGSPGETIPVKPAGEAALLDFFATWCAPCKPQMAKLGSVQSEHPDLHMISVSREQDADLIRDFWVEYEGTWPVAQDTRLEAFQEYDVTRIPTMVVLDAAGEEVWRHSGLAAAADIVEQVEEARS
jgi:thiol-disulfide isomerase/thioredoxin